MIKGLPIKELAKKIELQKSQKKDYIVPTEKAQVIIKEKKPLFEIPDQGQFPILPLAHNHIGFRTGIPAKYYDAMLAEAPDLLANNINTWFRLHHKKRMVRTLASNMRAFMSNKYQRIENEAIAEVALPILYDIPGVQIPSCEVTDRHLYIHFVVPSIQGEVKVGDVVQCGGIISNSEVGEGSASVSGLIWRLRCLNGMKTADTFRKTHVGRAVDDSEELWADDTRKVDDNLVLLKMRDMVRAVVDETRFRAHLDALKDLTKPKVTGNPERAIEVLAQKVGINETEKGGVLRALIEGADLSAWGLINAVTAQGHTAKTYDRAVQFEEAGGQLMAMPAADWKEVLEAA
jgi:hypothetical protein